MSNEMNDLIAEARRAQNAVYLATEKSVADDLARIIAGLADALEAATRELAAVPDAATCDQKAHDTLNWNLNRLSESNTGLSNALTAAVDERDAATAAVERVRAIHMPLSSLTWGAPEEFLVCEECNDPDARNFIYWPCPTLAALDGAPEPEWEYSRGVLHKCGLLEVGFGIPRDQVVRVRRRPAGPWLPVEGESNE